MSLTIEIPLIDKLSKVVNPSSVDTLLRSIATSLLPEIRDRIHGEGKKADGSQIGTYTPEYLKRRIKHGKTASPKIILSYTRQMQNDFKVIPLQGSYGLGFSNPDDTNKAEWAQDRFGKIYGLTSEETKQMQLIIDDWLEKNL